MKSRLLTPLEDAYLLRKRAIIETIFDQLKNINQIEHSRNRSITIISLSFCSYCLSLSREKTFVKNYHYTKQLLLFQ